MPDKKEVEATMKMARFLIATTILIILATGASAQIGPPPDGDDDGINPDQVTIHWPSSTGEYPTLQSAIDALPDEGGIVDISEGTHQIFEPVFIDRGGHVVIQGKGCDELPRGQNRNERFTHLQGPSTREVVEFSEAVGLFNQFAGSLVLRDLKLSGFDASAVHKLAVADDDPGATSDLEELGPPLAITSVCMTDTGRGIVSTAPGALTVEHALIRDVLWNGISVYSPQPFKFGQALNSFQLMIIQAQNACIVIKHAHAIFDGLECIGVGGNSGNYGFGDGGGIYVEDSVITLNNVTVRDSSRPGIVVNGGVTSITGLSLIEDAVGIALLFYEPIYGYVKGLSIQNTHAFSSGLFAGKYGDGINVAGRALGSSTSYGLVQVMNVTIWDSIRAALANFGGLVGLGDSKFACAAFELEGAPFLGNPFEFINYEGNGCGCPFPDSKCVAVSSSLEPPAPVSGQN